jgi:hypothetical protein
MGSGTRSERARDPSPGPGEYHTEISAFDKYKNGKLVVKKSNTRLNTVEHDK